MNLKEAYRTLIDHTKGNKPELLDNAIEVVVGHLKERFIHEDIKDALIKSGMRVTETPFLIVCRIGHYAMSHRTEESTWSLYYESGGCQHKLHTFQSDPVIILTALAALGVISID